MMLWLLTIACQQKETNQTEIDATEDPTSEDTAEASIEPSGEPSANPSDEPSQEASSEPSGEPSGEPSSNPSDEPSNEPTDDPSQDPLEIAGSYIDNTSTEHVITQTSWLLDYGPTEQYFYHITQYDNVMQYVIAENDASNGVLEAGYWSRFDWTYADNHLWVCQTTSNAATEAAALSTEVPDKSNPAEEGCRNYGWMRLN